MPATSGLCTSSSPTTGPGPGTTCTAPAGRPASRNTSYSFSPVNTPADDGLNTTVFPATSAPPIGPAASAIGKLNGLITPHTPYGFITLRLCSVFESASIGTSKPWCSSIWSQ